MKCLDFRMHFDWDHISFSTSDILGFELSLMQINAASASQPIINGKWIIVDASVFVRGKNNKSNTVQFRNESIYNHNSLIRRERKWKDERKKYICWTMIYNFHLLFTISLYFYTENIAMWNVIVLLKNVRVSEEKKSLLNNDDIGTKLTLFFLSLWFPLLYIYVRRRVYRYN